MPMDRAARVKTLDAGPSGAPSLHEDGERIAELLEELRATASPALWQRIEELVERLLASYGSGLSRVLQHSSETGSISPELVARLTRDELVSSLLLLHGLHPLPIRDRVILSLKAARTQLADAVSSIDLVELSGDELHVQVVKRPETSWANTEIEAALRGLIERRVPEVIQVEVAFEETAEAEPRLLSIVLGRSRRRTNK